MSATYLHVTIDGVEYDVYADIATADLYLNASTDAAAWRAADDDGKGRALVTATRVLDRMAYPGQKTDPDQALQWPRSNTGLAGVEDGVIPQQLIDACCELASQIANGVDVTNQQSTATGIKRQKAGSVEIEYFYGAGGIPLRLPLPVWELIRGLLGGDGAGGGARAFGTCGRSGIDRTYGFDQGL